MAGAVRMRVARGLSACQRSIAGNLCVQPPVPGERVGVAVIPRTPRKGWSHGLSHQEAPQAHGEEEAPQAAAQDKGSAQEQEVTAAVGPAQAGPAAQLPRAEAMNTL